MENAREVVEEKQWKYFLNKDEEELLKRCEKAIDHYEISKLEAAKALMVIRDEKLYRQSHKTFEDYCRERWAIARRTAYQLIDYVKVEGLCAAEHKPENEAQARALAPLLEQPERIPIAMQKAVELAGDEKITAKIVEKAVKEISEPKPEISEVEVIEEEPEDSQPFRELMRWWSKANARDRRRFLGKIKNKPPAGYGIEHYLEEDPDCKKAMKLDRKNRRMAIQASTEKDQLIDDFLDDIDLADSDPEDVWENFVPKDVLAEDDRDRFMELWQQRLINE